MYIYSILFIDYNDQVSMQIEIFLFDNIWCNLSLVVFQMITNFSLFFVWFYTEKKVACLVHSKIDTIKRI